MHLASLAFPQKNYTFNFPPNNYVFLQLFHCCMDFPSCLLRSNSLMIQTNDLAIREQYSVMLIFCCITAFSVNIQYQFFHSDFLEYPVPAAHLHGSFQYGAGQEGKEREESGTVQKTNRS